MAAEPGGGVRVVGVVGAGTMGAGIAQLCLHAGHAVVLFDADRAALERAEERIGAGLDLLVGKGRLDAAARDQASASLRLAGDLDDLAASADLVIEAVAEDLAVKRALFARLDARCAPAVTLATNTSSLSVGAIAEATAHPGRVLGLHFFNPAPVMPLVEVVVAERTEQDRVTRATAFVTGLGKTPQSCRDAPGFIVNRVARPFVREGLRVVEEGAASVAEVDAVLEAAGYPMGPLRLADLIGLDVEAAITAVLHTAFGGASRFASSALLDELVARGRLGRKSGAGFYRYGAGVGASAGERVVEPLPPGIPARAAPATARASLPATAIVERIELAVINEAYRAVGEGVAAPAEIDLAMRLGAGHPRGPFERAGDIGLRTLVARLHDLNLEQRATSDQFEVAPLLWHVATV